jgi:hypothetical protein
MGRQDPIDMVNEYIRRFGRAVGVDLHCLDPSGYTDVRHGSLVIGINAFVERDILLILVRMGTIPTAQPEELYRKLLELNFLATRSCSFAIDRQRGLVYLRAMRPLDGLDYLEFEDLLKTAASRLRDEVSELHD